MSSSLSLTPNPPTLQNQYYAELAIGVSGLPGRETPDYWVAKWEPAKVVQSILAQNEASHAAHRIHSLFWEFGTYGTLDITSESLEKEIRAAHQKTAHSLGTVLLNHPEVYLLQGETQVAFYARLKQSLEALQRLFEAGLISGYGISSRGFTLDQTDPAFVSLAVLSDLFEGRLPNGFRTVSFPLNLLEPGSLFGSTQDGHSVFDWISSQRHDPMSAPMLALIERPTLAWTGQYFLDLNEAPYAGTSPHDKIFNFDELKCLFEVLDEAEKALPERLKQELKKRFKLFPFSGLLRHRAAEFSAIERFQHGLCTWLNGTYLPGLAAMSQQDILLGPYQKAIVEWRDAYKTHLIDLKLGELREFSTRLEAVVPSLKRVPPLHLKFLAMLISIAREHRVPMGVTLPREWGEGSETGEHVFTEWTSPSTRALLPTLTMEETLDAWEKFLETYALSESADTVD